MSGHTAVNYARFLACAFFALVAWSVCDATEPTVAPWTFTQLCVEVSGWDAPLACEPATLTQEWLLQEELAESAAEIDFSELDTTDAQALWGDLLYQDCVETLELTHAPTPSSQAQAEYNGSSFNVSQDVIIRGSVNLPTLKSLQIWGNGYTGKGHETPKGWRARVNEENNGAVVGLNIPLGLATVSGFYNYHNNRVDYARNRIKQRDNSYGMAFYLNSGGFYMNATGTYGLDKYHSLNVGSSGSRLSIKGRQSSAYFETGYEMATLGMFVLKPFGSYQYYNLKHDAFDVNTLGLQGGKRNYNSCLMTLGSRVDLNLAGLDVFTLEGRMAWITELRKRSNAIQGFCYGRVPGTYSAASPYFVGDGLGSDAFWGGLGLRLSLMGMLSVAADYDCIVNKYKTLNEFSLGLLFGF